MYAVSFLSGLDIKIQRCTASKHFFLHRRASSSPLVSFGLNLRNNLINLVPQNLFPRHNALDFCVQLGNVDDLAGILLLHIGGYRQVIILRGNLVIGHKAAEIVLILAVNERGHDFCNVVLSQLVVVRNLNKFFRGINKQRLVLRLALFSTIMQVAILVPKNRLPGS